jgi:hypothetical protein
MGYFGYAAFVAALFSLTNGSCKQPHIGQASQFRPQQDGKITEGQDFRRGNKKIAGNIRR